MTVRSKQRSTFNVLAWCAAGCLAPALHACSTEQAYNAALGWRQNECNRVPDKAKRDRCIEAAGGPYDDYVRERERSR
jgi:hypothetical protein